MRWWRSVMAMELRKILAYRSDFWITFLGQTFIQLFIARALWQSIFETNHVTHMNGFDLSMITVYYLIIPIGNKILTGENIGFISREIYDGSFTRYLIYPISAFQYKHLTYFTHSLFFSAQLVFLVGLYALWTGVTLSIVSLSLGVCFFLLASFLYCLMAMAIELLSLWADNIWSLMVMLRFFVAFFGGGMIPLSFFPKNIVDWLNYTPFPYLLQFPAFVIMNRVSLEAVVESALILVTWIFIFLGVVQVIWVKGQKQYTGVGI